MFCFQCEQTAKGEGCTKIGVCGKQPDVAALQDLLMYAVKGLAQVALAARRKGIADDAIDHFACEAVFSTLTNVDFDPRRFVDLIQATVAHRNALGEKLTAAGGQAPSGDPAGFVPGATLEALVAQGEGVGVMADSGLNEDIRSLRELLTYGIKGLAAYADHAFILGQKDPVIFDFIYEGLAATLDDSPGCRRTGGLNLKCGEVNLTAMELLDAGNTGTYGHPVPTKPFRLGNQEQGKAILVSGHDLEGPGRRSCNSPPARASLSTPTGRCCLATVTRS
jgi:hydroxylamine reductase